MTNQNYFPPDISGTKGGRELTAKGEKSVEKGTQLFIYARLYLIFYFLCWCSLFNVLSVSAILASQDIAALRIDLEKQRAKNEKLKRIKVRLPHPCFMIFWWLLSVLNLTTSYQSMTSCITLNGPYELQDFKYHGSVFIIGIEFICMCRLLC